MKIYLYDDCNKAIQPYLGSEQIDFNTWSIVLVHREKNDAKLTGQEMQLLIQQIGYKNIAANKVHIYTPELLLAEKCGDRDGAAMIKLGNDCLIYENQQLRYCLPLEVKNLKFLKKMAHSDLCIFDEASAKVIGQRSLNKEIIANYKIKSKYRQLPLLIAGLFVLFNIGLIFYEHSLSEMTESIAPARITPAEEEYQSILEAGKNVDEKLALNLDIFAELAFDKITVKEDIAVLTFRNMNMEAVTAELEKIDRVTGVKVTNIHEEASGSRIIIEVRI